MSRRRQRGLFVLPVQVGKPHVNQPLVSEDRGLPERSESFMESYERSERRCIKIMITIIIIMKACTILHKSPEGRSKTFKAVELFR
jgi:hypothetical protein